MKKSNRKRCGGKKNIRTRKNKKIQKYRNTKGCLLGKCQKGCCSSCLPKKQKGGCGGSCSVMHGELSTPAHSNNLPLAYTGGSQGPIQQINSQNGGYSPSMAPNNQIIYAADGLTGSPWTPTHLPGSNLVAGNYNHYSQYNTDANPAYQMINSRALSGGRRTKHKKSVKKGGASILPQDLTNLGRQISFYAGSAYNSLNGFNAPVNPLPYEGQLVGTPNVSALRL